MHLYGTVGGRLRRRTFALAVGLLLLLAALPARAQRPVDGLVVNGRRVVSIRALPPALVPDPQDICIYRASGRTAGTLVRVPSREHAPALRAQQPAPANITIDYNAAFTEAAREALRRAADIWEQHVESTVPIRIQAAWVDTLGENTLASAGTTLLFAFEFEDGEHIAFPSALTDALIEEDQRPGEPDIVMYVNGTRDDWHFGRGDPAPGEIDFASVALHEITHGLGFYGSMSAENLDADSAQEGTWGFDFSGLDEPVPAVYDVSRSFITGSITSATEDESGTLLTDYPTPSEELANALTDSVFFNGPLARLGNATDLDAPDVRPELHAPETWNPGSSYSHVDEMVYPAGDLNSLMTPLIGGAEKITSPGGIVCGILGDMGWPLAADCLAFLGDLIVFNAAPLPEEDAANLKWVVDANSQVERVVIQQCSPGDNRCEGDFQPVDTIRVSDPNICNVGQEVKIACQYRVAGLERPGTYTFGLVLIYADGTTTGLSTEEAFLPAMDLIVEVFPNPFFRQATMRVVLPDEEPRRLVVDAYDTLGQLVRRRIFEEVSGEEFIPIDAENLGAAGMYFIRVRAEDFSDTHQVVLLR